MAALVQPLTKPPAKSNAWKALAAHYKTASKLHLRQLFQDDPKRGERMAVEAVGLYLDYSKNRITEETLRLLFDLAEAVDLRGQIDAMFRGTRSTSLKGERYCTPHYGARRAPRSWSTARMWCRWCTPCSIGWLGSPTASAAVCGRGTPGAASGTLSTSASAVPTSAR